MPGFYATDLAPVGTASVADTGGTYPTAPLELTGYASGSIVSTTTPDTDNFIQGTAGLTGLSSKTANTGNSIVYGRGSTLAIAGGNCLNIWVMYALPSALELIGFSTAAGVQIAVGTAAGSFSTYRVDGRDVSPYGGWRNYIVDLRNTNTGPNSGGSTGVTTPTNSYFGATWWQNAAFKTAVPLAIDAIRYGRQTLSATQGTNTTVNHTTPLTSTAANFPQMAYYNDYNAGGTPQLSGTNIGTAVDGGYHRFGSLQEVSGGFLARGILSLGTTAASVYFDDANRNINFEDMFLTYNDFNRLEIRNASSTVKFTACNFSFIPRPAAVISAYAPATPRGNFQMHDNAAVTITSCTFTDMGTFTFLSNATVSGTTFRRCNQISPAGATFNSGTTFTSSNDTTGAILITTPSDIANMSSCNFTGNTKAIKITTAGTYSFNGHQFSGNTTEVDYTGTAATKTITNATSTGTALTFTSAGHGYTTNQVIVVKNVVSSGPDSYNNAANEYYTITSTTTDTFTVASTKTPGTYTSGGIATIPCLISPSNSSNVNFSNCTASGGGYIVVDTPSVNLTFEGLISGSEVRVIRQSDKVELGGIESSSTSYTFSHKYGGTVVDIYILHLSYQWYAIRSYTLLSSNATIPVAQIADRQYLNP